MKKEDIEFLRELQNELRTQTNDGNAQPVFWGVIEEKEVVANEDYDDCYALICDDDGNHYTLEEAIEMVVNDYKFDAPIQQEWDELDKTDIDDVADFIDTYIGGGDSVVYFKKEQVISRNTGAFLTKRACQKYIDNFGYNHKNPRTFAMTAYRNFELERLLDILTNMNIDDIIVDNMNIEEIERKASKWVDSYPRLADGAYDQADVDAMMYNSFIEGSTWMQRQSHKDFLEANAEIEKQHVQDIRDLQEKMIEQARNAFCHYCQFDCEGHPHDDCTLLQEFIQTIKGER